MSTLDDKQAKNQTAQLPFTEDDIFVDPPEINAIHAGDCVELLKQMEDSSVDLLFADPPFNIGYEYDKYDDQQTSEDYLDWCEAWITQTYRVLKPTGSFWLAIGDEYAAELKVLAKRLGYVPRNWVVWYYTFGQNCSRKFNRSHAHLFHFVKDEQQHTFNADDPKVRVPSARALVYGDKRANPTGRLPDDTWIVSPERNGEWILRPQDLQDAPGAFDPLDNTWYYSRVAGTFKERQGFHGCQMPEQLLGRIIRICSNEGDLVVDPFSGSGTTLAVAKKLSRRWIGFELSDEYVRYGNERLSKCKVGQSLVGPEDPVSNAPKTAAGRKLKGHPLTDSNPEPAKDKPSGKASGTSNPTHSLIDLSRKAIVDAFLNVHEGKSVDWLLCDPDLQHTFHANCAEAGLFGNTSDWNRELLKLRKAGQLPKFRTERINIPGELIDRCAFAAEIAWRESERKYPGVALDKLFASPGKSLYFDRTAAKQLIISSDQESIQPAIIRWAALRLRKSLHKFANEAKQFDYVLRKRDFARFRPLAKCRTKPLEHIAGLYLLRTDDKSALYLGETLDLGKRIHTHQESRGMSRHRLSISIITSEELPSDEYRQPLWTHLNRQYRPLWNIEPAEPTVEE